LPDRSQQLARLAEFLGFYFDTETSYSLAEELMLSSRAPNEMAKKLERAFGGQVWIYVGGAIDGRVILVGEERLRGRVVSLGAPLDSHTKLQERLNASAERRAYLGEFVLTEAQRIALLKPTLALIALYHPEVFPLPRFPLGISDLARALRKEIRGTVHLMDMQLGMSIEDILHAIDLLEPDIVGYSATFGQHDILVALHEQIITKLNRKPMTIAGGSLGVLNRDVILHDLGIDFVATGAGEQTITKLATLWSGSCDTHDIPDIAFLGTHGEVITTSKTSNRTHDDIMPELDLLDATLSRAGVMQLESSRGCSYACSFCPRSHKGIWAGEDPIALEPLLEEIEAAFSSFPQLDRRIFLVDEEFVGYQPDEFALPRGLGFAQRLKRFGFDFETSSRIDQVARRNRPREWHIKRMGFWRQLREDGLSRCLFGIESGVNSVLERFNKKTTSDQNALGIRILTALDIPIRCTYITFDPLMSFEELEETYRFLGRTDVIMKPCTNLSEDEIFDLLEDDQGLIQLSANIPFYSVVSYMLVSMEALVGSEYLKMVEAAGLAGEFNPLMGRREVTYKDPRIGRLSALCQRWVDRNFSFDYVLKSLEKILPKESRQFVRRIRYELKDSAYHLLGAGIELLRGQERHSRFVAVNDSDPAEMTEEILEVRFARLQEAVRPLIECAVSQLPSHATDMLSNEWRSWAERKEWQLINGVCE